MSVKAKKYFGQHFLTNKYIAKNIVNTLSYKGYNKILEIGPGTGILTQYLLQNMHIEIHVIEIDLECISYLKAHYPDLIPRIHHGDFLKLNLIDLLGHSPFAIIGNFPYKISSQIVFKVLENRTQIPEFSGMFQKEVATRICGEKGSKNYGILSVLSQAFYKVEYLFTVDENVFNPPPKVKSGVIRFIRKDKFTLSVDEFFFFTVVKKAFNQRRKTLRNSLKVLLKSDEIRKHKIFNNRPEQLSVDMFIELTSIIEKQ